MAARSFSFRRAFVLALVIPPWAALVLATAGMASYTFGPWPNLIAASFGGIWLKERALRKKAQAVKE
ncbi:MAG: hypothetical protein F4Y00_07840 [Bacteroidetes bacterium SB0662_bin_6]|nr:hypothetical protein [Gammaproteobacteria bacterium]MYE04864.1 hypothetical protein [Bacteroidetes bacterium SB0662_bin_6]